MDQLEAARRGPPFYFPPPAPYLGGIGAANCCCTLYLEGWLRRALLRGNFVPFSPRFAQADCNRLFTARHLPAAARAKFATFELVHLLADLLLSLAAVFSARNCDVRGSNCSYAKSCGANATMCPVSAKNRWSAATMPTLFDDAPCFYVGGLPTRVTSSESIANARTMNSFRAISMWICE